MEVLNLGADGRFVLTARLSGDDTVVSAVLSGLRLTLREVFAS